MSTEKMIYDYRRIIVLLNALLIGFDIRIAVCNVAALNNVAKYSIPQSDNSDHLESLSRTHSLSPLSSTDEDESEKNKNSCESYDYCSDKMGYEALKALHQQLDDDANGNIDIAESDEFLRDELHYENGYERQKGFHRNDKYISVDELWQSWVISEVHNWTTEDTIEWLVSSVELPQYVKNFQENAVDGTTLPRMAVNNAHFLSSVLGIKDPIHKQKIVLKAMDVVLFGPPRHHNYVKDVLLVLSLVIAIGGCWFAYVQHKYAQTHMSKMVKDMESLQHAEEALLEIQKELDKANMEREDVVREKQNLERRLRNEVQMNAEGTGLSNEQLKMHELEEKLQSTQEELKRAEKALESKCWVPPSSLQHWLQMTHELELKHYNAKKSAAEQQLAAAKEGCEKLRKRRSSFLGAFRIAHGGSIDDVDNRILQAKAALSEVTKDLQERLHRWRQIELLCGFPVVVNPGLIHLESLLQRSSCNGTTALQSYSTAKSIVSNDSDNALTEDELAPSFTARGSADNVHSIDSLSNIHTPGSIFRRPFCIDSHGSILTGSLDHSPVLIPELKHCASSGAILQMSSSPTSTEQYVNSKQSEEEICEDNSPDSVVSLPTLSSGGASGEGNRPNFTLGDSLQDTPPPVKNNTPNKRMIKSHSHDNHSAAPREISQIFSLSESCLSLVEQNSAAESKSPTATNIGSLKVMGRQKKSSTSSAVLRSSIVDSVLDEEVSSESSPATESEGQKEKKKRLFLPNLKKKKAKAS